MICPAKALREYVWLELSATFPISISDVALGGNTIGMAEDALEGTEVIGGKGVTVSVGMGGSVPVSVGVMTGTVEVATEMDVGEPGTAVAVDCGSRVFT